MKGLICTQAGQSSWKKSTIHTSVDAMAAYHATNKSVWVGVFE